MHGSSYDANDPGQDLFALLVAASGAARKAAPFGAFVQALLSDLFARWLALDLVLAVPAMVQVGEKATDARSSRCGP